MNISSRAISLFLRAAALVFPVEKSSPRAEEARRLIKQNATPTPAVDDHILRGLNATALFSYADPNVRAIVQSLKYDGQTELVEWLVARAVDTLAEDIAYRSIFERTPILVIPIPLSSARLIERGFNQSGLIAQGIARGLNESTEYCDTCLARSSFEKSQTLARTRSARAENIREAFFVADPTRVLGRDVLIVDDVITTGATTHEAARVLRAAGAKSVSCFALAH